MRLYFSLSLLSLFSVLEAGEFIVDHGGDGGDRSLRWAIEQANKLNEASTIKINNSVTSINVTNRLPIIKQEMTITSLGGTTINGNNQRLFVVKNKLTIEKCTVQNGEAKSGDVHGSVIGGGGGLGAGGAVFVHPGCRLTLVDTILQNNKGRGGNGGSGYGGGYGDGGGSGASFSSLENDIMGQKVRLEGGWSGGGGDNPGLGSYWRFMNNPVGLDETTEDEIKGKGGTGGGGDGAKRVMSGTLTEAKPGLGSEIRTYISGGKGGDAYAANGTRMPGGQAGAGGGGGGASETTKYGPQ